MHTIKTHFGTLLVGTAIALTQTSPASACIEADDNFVNHMTGESEEGVTTDHIGNLTIRGTHNKRNFLNAISDFNNDPDPGYEDFELRYRPSPWTARYSYRGFESSWQRYSVSVYDRNTDQVVSEFTKDVYLGDDFRMMNQFAKDVASHIRALPELERINYEAAARRGASFDLPNGWPRPTRLDPTTRANNWRINFGPDGAGIVSVFPQ